ncbi:MAG TPA: 4'-phosphopantetheinyl transferase superfamily protein [Gemmatimonadaceae bacterium]
MTVEDARRSVGVSAADPDRRAGFGLSGGSETKVAVLLGSVESRIPSVAVIPTIAPWSVDGLDAVAVRVAPVSSETRVDWATSLPLQWRSARLPRVASFLAGRYCAERALKAAGSEETMVEVGDEREPVWPRGFVGSITHTATFAGAVVARENGIVGIGIDTEDVLSAAQSDSVRQTVAPEFSAINFVGLHGDPQGDALAMSCVFSAKESIYKCLHPLVREFFEFSDVSVTTVDRVRGTMHAVLNRPLGNFPRHWPLEARFIASDGRVHTSVVLRATQLPPEVSATFGVSA